MKIRIAPAASAHLSAAFEYLDAINPKAATAQMKRIFDGIDQLKKFPESAPVGRVEGARELVIQRTSFIVVYSIEADIINIIAILHGSQRWPQMS